MATDEQVLDTLISLAEAITVANGYQTTVDTVERGFTDWTEVGTGKLPYMCIAHESTSYTAQYSNTERAVGTFSWLCVQATTSHDNATQLNRTIRQDVRKALYTNNDLSVSGIVSAKMTRRQSLESYREAVKAGKAVMLLTIEVTWEESIP